MSNTPRLGSQSAPASGQPDRLVWPVRSHGRKGHVGLATSVPPALKDHLIEYCQQSGSTMKDAIEQALCQFLYEVRS